MSLGSAYPYPHVFSELFQVRFGVACVALWYCIIFSIMKYNSVAFFFQSSAAVTYV